MIAHFRPNRIIAPAIAPLFAVAVAVMALGAAYYSQYIIGLHPCTMCYWQRIPYGVMILLGITAFFLRGKQPRVSRALVWLCWLALIASVGLGAFHAGVEYGWWTGPGACSGSVGAGVSDEELLAKILAAPAVSCSAAAIHVLGLSMAAWNAVYALFAAIALFVLLRRSVRR